MEVSRRGGKRGVVQHRRGSEPKDSESIECYNAEQGQRVEVSMDIIFNRDIKGSLIRRDTVHCGKKAKGIVRFYWNLTVFRC